MALGQQDADENCSQIWREICIDTTDLEDYSLRKVEEGRRQLKRCSIRYAVSNQFWRNLLKPESIAGLGDECMPTATGGMGEESE